MSKAPPPFVAGAVHYKSAFLVFGVSRRMTALYETILDYWFGQSGSDTEIARRQASLWWRGGSEIDTEIHRRFGALHEQAAQGELDSWLVTPRGRLALIIVLDQFSRNIHRGSARAFAQDERAQALALEALRTGEYRQLRRVERVFLYMPLEHAETLELQRKSVECFTGLRDAAPDDEREVYGYFLEFAWRHYDVVARFGRFPHRNAALGRATTPEEQAFLQ